MSMYQDPDAAPVPQADDDELTVLLRRLKTTADSRRTTRSGSPAYRSFLAEEERLIDRVKRVIQRLD